MIRSMVSSLALTALLTAPALAQEVWISNERDATISIIDVPSLEVIETIKVGARPRGIMFSHDYSVAYLCASDDSTIQVIDVATRQILHNLPSGENPETFALHPDNRHIWISNEDDNITSVLDVVDRRIVAQIPVGVEPEGKAINHAGTIAITTSETTNMAHWIDTETHQIFQNSLVGSRPRHAEFTSDDRRLFVSAEIGGGLHVFDTETFEELAEIRFEIPDVHPHDVQPVGFRLTRDMTRAYVALGPANRVAVVDIENYQVLGYHLVGRRVWHMAMSDDEKLLFTTNGVSGDVTIIDLERGVPIKTVKVGRFPWGAAYRPADS